MAPPASDDDWFEDYDSGGDTEMSDASAHFSKESDPYASDSDGCSARSGSDASDDARDDDFLEQTASDASPHSDHRKRLYTVIDRASLKRMTVRGCTQRADVCAAALLGFGLRVGSRRHCSARLLCHLQGKASVGLAAHVQCCFVGFSAYSSEGLVFAFIVAFPPWPPAALAPQDEALSQVQSILGCTTTTARALLIFFNWDAEAVLGGCRPCPCPAGMPR
jgi:hypothetical protein